MDKILNFAKGQKTYITAILGVLIAAAGWILGPIDIGSVTIPAMSFGEFTNLAWNALLAVFIRKGISG